jgi:DNA-directed RNA polymerase subunit RPC12/RpoP
MKELFIKCPSCGAVLQVKNSKNEAVKQITCPNCKHRLAVSFEEDTRQPSAAPQPLGSLYYGEMPIPLQEGINETQFPGSKYVELNVVRLANGGSKCIIKAVGTEETVKVNNETLQKDDQVVLAKGDKLEIGHVTLFYDKPCSLTNDENKSEMIGSDLTPSQPQSKASYRWFYAVGAIIIFGIGVFLFLSKSKTPQVITSGQNDSAIVTPPAVVHKSTPNVVKTAPKDKSKDIVKPDTPQSPNYESMPDYDLERLALHNDAKAQYVLGKRFMNKKGSSNIILGLNYLRMASKNGSKDAGNAWQKHVRAIQERAELGDSVAYEILKKID